MSDITMCTQSLCPNASTCYRRTATPDKYQSYCQFVYIVGIDGVECAFYWPNYRTETIYRTTNLRKPEQN